VADFYGVPLAGEAPLSVQFTEQCVNAPSSWEWNFGDGSPLSSQRNPRHDYTLAGRYTVSLTATNGEGADTETKTGYINVSAATSGTETWEGYK
jgi:PKD repeat protein